MNTSTKMGIARAGSFLFLCAASLSQVACGGTLYADAQPETAAAPPPVYAAPPAYAAAPDDQNYVEVDTVPPDIESYPSFYIDGGNAYYVDGRWYRHGTRGWAYYRHEPPQLERQRVTIQQAPPSRREPARVEQAPRAEPPRPVERERARVEQAPPAGRPERGVIEAQPAARGPAPHAAPPRKVAPLQKHEEQHEEQHDHH